MSKGFYKLLWSLYLLTFASVWILGGMSQLALVGFGFTANALVFIGMICALPGWVAHPESEVVDPSEGKMAGHHAMSPSRNEKGIAMVRSA